jgi:hypothetical protein
MVLRTVMFYSYGIMGEESEALKVKIGKAEHEVE